MQKFTNYNGKIMLFGLFHIRKSIDLKLQCNGNPYEWNKAELEKIAEPIVQKYCTIKWIEVKS